MAQLFRHTQRPLYLGIIVILLMLSVLTPPLHSAQAAPLAGDGDNPPAPPPAAPVRNLASNTTGSIPVSMIADINPGQANSSPQGMSMVGDTLFFSAIDGAHGRELWVSDPPYKSSRMVMDINPEKNGSDPKRITAIGTTVFFTANDGLHGMELWKSDPPYTTAVLVKDINSGGNGAFPRDLQTVGFEKYKNELVAMGTNLIFAADDGQSGTELWKSEPPYNFDSTVRISDIRYGRDSSAPHELTQMGWTLFFIADDGTNRSEIFRSDLPYSSVVRVSNINPSGNANVTELTFIGETLLFGAQDKKSGLELWKSLPPYGFDNARRVTDLVSEPTNLNPIDLVPVGQTLFFTGYHILSGYELWKSDPPYEATTTVRVGDINPGNKDYFDDSSKFITYTGNWSAWKREGWGFYNDTLHFSNNPGNTAIIKFSGPRVTVLYSALLGRGTLGVYIDGRKMTTLVQAPSTTATSFQDRWDSPMLTDGDHTLQLVHSGVTGTSVNFDAVVPRFFTAPSTTENREPYRELTGASVYDDSNTDIHYEYSWYGVHDAPAFYNQTRHFSNKPGSTATLSFSGSNVSIMYTQNLGNGKMDVLVDGTVIGTINENGLAMVPQSLWDSPTFANGDHTLVLRHASGGDADFDAIFTYNYIKPKPIVEKQVNAFKKIAIGDTLIFRAFEQGNGMELYKITPPYMGENIKRIAEVNKNVVGSSYPYGSSYPDDMHFIGTTMFFTASDFGQYGRELWLADPPYFKPQLVADIMPGGLNSNPTELATSGQALFFAAASKGRGIELWKMGNGSASRLPNSGFAPDILIDIGAQPKEKAYSGMGDLWLEIPGLGVQTPILGVPAQPEGGWDLTWLDNNAGYLDGTAYPTWNGNTVITAHLYLPNGKPGPFEKLQALKWGDKFFIHAFGQRFIYEVRSTQTITPDDLSVMGHKDEDWVTLITCKEYDAAQNTYRLRSAVQALRIAVVEDTGIFK